MVVGGMIGMEREYRNKAAGLKSHVLICLGATSLTYLSTHLSTQGDPARIAAQIVSGIGFIGGGAILHSNRMIQGLTSASTLWVSTAVGMLMGAGLIVPAWTLACMILIFLLVSNKLTQGHRTKRKYAMIIQVYQIEALASIEALLDMDDLLIEKKEIKRKKCIEIELAFFTFPLVQHVLMKRLLTLKGIGDILAI